MFDLNVLFSAAGRRVSLLRHFKKTISAMGIRGKVYAADSGKSAPAGFIADQYLNVPSASSPNYIPDLLSICKKYEIKLLFSLIDTDLELLSKHKEDFEIIGTKVLVCDTETNEICFNKQKTWEFFVNNKIDTPHLYSKDEINQLGEKEFPLLVKPWDGSCSVGVHIVHNHKELEFFSQYVKNAIVQEYLEGDEYTCDAYVDFEGKTRCVVPRKRVETRGGEVSKGLTVNDPEIIAAVTDVVSKLPNAVGCITVQCFKQESGRISFIEINPRFGGGHPLSLHAGADFPKWIIQEFCGLKCEASQNSWKHDLAMLRYDDEIITEGVNIQ